MPYRILIEGNDLLKKNVIMGLILISVMMVNNIVFASEEIKMNLHAKGAIVVENKSGRILYGQHYDEQMAMASTTKIMTCIIALENCDLNEIVQVSKLATKAPPVKLYIKEGEKYCLEDLLYALMLQSSNDVAIAIAEHVGGSVENFCDMMTSKAHELGAKDTSFKTPNGLDADGHYTTARNLALIAIYAMKNDKFVEIINTKNKTISSRDGSKKQHNLVNKNSFLFAYSDSNGIKTGFTSKAGYCYVGSACKNNMNLISVVLASGWPPHKTFKFDDTRKLLDYGFNNFEMKVIPDQSFSVKNIKVIDGQNDNVSCYIEKITKDIPLSKQDQISYDINIMDEIQAPVIKGDIVGSVKVYLNNENIYSMPIKTTEEVKKIDFIFNLKKIIDITFKLCK